MIAGIGLIDYTTDAGMSFSLFYVLAIGFVSWFAGKRYGYMAAIAAAIVWLLADVLGGVSSHPAAYAWNGIIRLGVLLLIAVLLARVYELTRGLEKAVQKQTAHLTDEIARRREIEKEITEISSREQRRIARELHDGLGQHLAGIAFKAKNLAEDLAKENSSGTGDAEELVRLICQGVGQSRSLARVLLPGTPESGDLRGALTQLAGECQKLFAIECAVSGNIQPPTLDENSIVHLYRIAQEAITNAFRHGKASRIEIEMSVSLQQLRITIADNGNGFPNDDGRSEAPGMGLNIMRYRAHSLGGTLEIQSEPGAGCRVVCEMPLKTALNSPPIFQTGAKHRQPSGPALVHQAAVVS
jgi:signal transduction histidine kinase